MIPNFIFSSKENLRKGVNFDELDLSEEEFQELQSKKHVPNAISQLIFKKVVELKKQGKISEQEFFILNQNMNAFLDSLGACERIRNTPIPFSYSLFLKKFIFIYVTTLPLAFVTIFGYYAALIATFVFYVLVSMEVLAEEIEDPFGTDDNDLPTDSISEKIKDNIYEIFNL
jgi:putative membrane protein